MWEWEDDPEFAALPDSEKRRIRSNYFDANLTDAEFWTLPEKDQQRIREKFLSQFETAGPRHGKLGSAMGEFVPEEPQPELTGKRLSGAFLEGIKDVARETLQTPIMFKEAEERHPLIGKLLKATPEPVGIAARLLSEAGRITSAAKPIIERTLTTAPEYEDKSSGYIEDVVRTAPQVLTAFGTGAIGGGLLKRAAIKGAERLGQTLAKETGWEIFKQGAKASAGAQMFSQIAGGTYKDLRKEGVDEDRAFVASLLNASLQTPLENVGFEKILTAWKPGRPIYKKIVDFLAAAGAEAAEEFVQQYPEEFSKTWAKQADKSTVKAIGEFIQKLPQTTKEALYSSLVALPLGAAAAGVGTVASRTAAPEMEPGRLESNFNQLLKYRRELVDEIKESLATGQTASGQPFSIDEVMRLRHDPDIRKLGILDQLNDIVIEHWAQGLEPYPDMEAAASARSGALMITEPPPLELMEEIPPSNVPILGTTPPAGTALRPSRSGGEAITGDSFSNKLLAYRRKNELKAQGIEAEVVPVKGGYAVYTIEEKPLAPGKELAWPVAKSAAESARAFEIEERRKQLDARKQEVKKYLRDYLDTLVRQHPKSLELLNRQLARGEAAAKQAQTVVQEPEKQVAVVSPQESAKAEEIVTPPQPPSEMPATTESAMDEKLEEELPKPTTVEVTERKPRKKSKIYQIQVADEQNKETKIEVEGTPVKSPKGLEDIEFFLHPSYNKTDKWSVSEASTGYAVTIDANTPKEAVNRFRQLLAVTNNVEYLREKIEGIRSRTTSEEAIKTKEEKPVGIESQMAPITEEGVASTTPAEEKPKETKPPVIEALDKATPDELIEEFKRQLAKKTPTLKREVEIRKQMEKKKKEAKQAFSEIRRLAREISDIIGGERGSISFKEVDPAKWDQVRDKLWQMYDKAIEAGLAMKEFVSLAVHLLGAKGLPYFEKFAREELPKGKKSTEIESKNVEISEPEQAGAVGAINVDLEQEEKELKKGKKTKIRKLLDAGERMAGKRSSKDPRERASAIKVSLDEMKDNETAESYIKKLENVLKQNKIFNPSLADTATPGLRRFVRYWQHNVPSILDAVYPRTRNRIAVIASMYERDQQWAERFQDKAAKYLSAFEQINELLSGVATVQEVFDRLSVAFGKPKETVNIYKGLFFEKGTGTDLALMIGEIFEDRMTGFMHVMQSFQQFSDNETLEIVEPQPIVRPLTRLEEIQTPQHIRNNKDVTPEEFIKEFNLRGAEFGEWTEAEHRQHSVNLAFDSLAMLAEVLNAPRNGIGLPAKTKLGIGFGSRGRGGKAGAHYEPQHKVINLTKTHGDGALAHEWGHAFYDIGFESTKLDNNKNPQFRAYNALDDLIKALTTKYDLDYVEDRIHEILNGAWGQAKAAERLDEARNFLRYRAMNSVKEKTDFKKNADALDKEKKGKPYWSIDTELFARAFEAWISDSLSENNEFLVNSLFVSEGYMKDHFGQLEIYPQGDERRYFNQLFTTFFSSLEWDENGVPRLKPDYVPVTVQAENEIKQKLTDLDRKLESILNAIYQGEKSQWNLYWYAYKTTSRGLRMQPANYSAYDDSFQIKESKGKGAVGYAQPLDVEKVLAFGLTPVKIEDSTTAIWAEAKDVTIDDWRDGFDATLGGEVLSEGEKTAGRGETREIGGGNLGQGSGRLGGPDIAPGDSAGVRSGEAHAGIGQDAGGSVDLGDLKAIQQTQRKDYVLKHTEIQRGRSLTKRFNQNLAALRVIKELEAQNRLATVTEQAILAGFSGWGGLGPALTYLPTQEWDDKSQLLRNILNDEELQTARAASLNAYYTPPELIVRMWEIAQRLGFRGGRILEPAVGIGHIIGMMPEELRAKSTIIGVEMDKLSAKIASQLYQSRTILNQKFEETTLPLDFFDLVIGNVPFGNEKIVDPIHAPKGMSIHNYFISKSLDVLKPGGLFVALSSFYTMDSSFDRTSLAKKADLVAAIRLPNGIFDGAEAGADLLIFRKKRENLPDLPPSNWSAALKSVQFLRDNIKYYYDINQYWHDNPDHVIGVMGTGPDRRLNVSPPSGSLTNYERKLDELIEKLPSNITVAVSTEIKPLSLEDMLSKPNELKEDAFYIKGSKLYRNQFGKAEEVSGNRRLLDRIKGMVYLRDKVLDLLRSQATEKPQSELEASRRELKSLYDAFVKKFGPLNSAVNVRAFAKDPDAYLLLGLEEWDEEKQQVRAISPIFTRNTLTAPTEPTIASDPHEALILSLAWRNKVDIPYIAKLLNSTQEKAIESLGDSIFDDPQKGWVTADEYLSGDVVSKLQVARLASKVDQKYQRNVNALTAVQPTPIPAEEIRWQLGSVYVPAEAVQAFIEDLIPSARGHISVARCEELGRWTIEFQGYRQSYAKRVEKDVIGSYESTRVWGVVGESGGSINFFELMDKILNGGMPVVKATTKDGTVVVDQAATEIAAQMYERIKTEFVRWILSPNNSEYAKESARRYNLLFNRWVPRKFSGEHLNFVGKVPDEIIGLRQHQKAAIYRFLQTGKVYLAHEVGTGKTFTMIAAAMESRRFGLSKKPMIVVPKQTVTDIRNAFQKLYPGAKVLYLDVPGNKDKRKAILSKIAVSDFDAVIVTHQSFGKIPLSPELRAEFVKAEKDKLEAFLAHVNATAAGGRRGGKLLRYVQKAIASQEAQLQRLLDMPKDDVPTFDQLGIDCLMVDEAHEFKNLSFFTNFQNVKGINPRGSQRSMDMYAKVQYLQKRFGRGVLLASGTPLTNSIGELFTISRYLQNKELEDRGISVFDAWANTFGVIGQETEPAIEGGGYKIATRFRKFVNLPELMALTHQVLDIVKFEDVITTGGKKLQRPKLKEGQPIPVVVPANPAVKAYREILKQRAMAIRVNPKEAKYNDKPDNILVIATHARLVAMDPRLLFPNERDYKDTKTNYCVKNVVDIYKQTLPAIDWQTGQDYLEDRHVQLIFSDRGIPKGSGFSVYEDLRKKLIKAGIPASQIAIIHDYSTQDDKKRLYRELNKGKIRVVIGSTKKLGTGLNIQQRVSAIHHLDVDWNYANYEQRNGRGWRWGNRIKELAIYNYGTEGTIDAFMWDKVAMKGRVLGQVMSNDPVAREIEDISKEAMLAEEMVAVLSDDPLTKEKIEREKKLRQLDNEYQWFLRRQAEATRMLDRIPSARREAQATIEYADEVNKIISGIQAIRFPEKFLGQDITDILPKKDKEPRLVASIEKHGPEINRTIKEVVRKFKVGTNFVHKFGQVGRIKEDGGFVPIPSDQAQMGLVINPAENKINLVITIGVNSAEAPIREETFSVARTLNAFRDAAEKKKARAIQTLEKLQLDEKNARMELEKTFNTEELTEARAALEKVTAELVEKQRQQEEQWRREGKTVEIKDGRLIYDIDISEWVIKDEEEPIEDQTDEVVPRDIALSGELFEEAEEPETKLAVEARRSNAPGAFITLSDVRKLFKTEDAHVANDGTIFVRTKNGRILTINRVEHIDPNTIGIITGYGKSFDAKKVEVVGTYKKGKITISRKGKEPLVILTHEAQHWMEDIGLFNPFEIAALKAEINKRYAAGEFTPVDPKNVGGSEDRARFLAEQVNARNKAGFIGKLVTKIIDFLDKLASLFTNSPSWRQIIKSVETGEIFGRPGKTGYGTKYQLSFESIPDDQRQILDSFLQAAQQPWKKHEIKGRETTARVIPMVDQARLQAEVNSWLVTLSRTLKSYLPKNLPTGSFLEQFLRTAEWWDHPVLQGIFRIAHMRGDRYTELFREIDENSIPLGEEHESVVQATLALKHKGLSRKEIVRGKKASKEYRQLQQMLDYGDTVLERSGMTPEELMKFQEDYWRARGVGDETIKVWKMHRAAYDRALDLQQASLREVLEKLKEKKAHEIVAKLAPANLKAMLAQEKDKKKAYQQAIKQLSPALRQSLASQLDAVDLKDFIKIGDKSLSLKQVLARMDSLRGTYAPRIRLGQWVVKGTKGKQEIRYHEKTRLAAERRRLQLEQQGWKIGHQTSSGHFEPGVYEVRRLPEEVYQTIRVLDTQALINKAIERGQWEDPQVALSVRRDLLEEVANLLLARGYRGHHLHRRRAPVVRGFIEDPLERYTRYTSNVAAGIAKSETAYQMIVTLNGTFDENGKRQGGIDPVREPRAFVMAQRYIAEQLRNADGVDRVIGLAKAIASLKYLGLPNVRAPFVNLTAMATTVPAAIHEYIGKQKISMPKILKEVSVAIKDYSRFHIGKTAGLTKDELAFLTEIKKNKIDAPQYTREAMGVIQSSFGRNFTMALNGAMFLFDQTERINRGATLLAAFRLAKQFGNDNKTAHTLARIAMEKAHGIYGRETLPSWAQGTNPLARVGQAYYTYMKFGHNYMQMLYDLGVKKQNYKAFAWGLGSQMVIGGIMSTPLAAIGWTILKAILRPFTDKDPEKWWWDTTRDILGPYGEQILRYGLAGALGADISGSLAFDPAVPKNLRDLTGALGGTISDIGDAFHYWMTGQQGKAIEAFLPIGIANIFRAIRELNGATTRAGNRLWTEDGQPYVPGAGATVLRALGFRSAERAMLQERLYEAKKQAGAFASQRNQIYEEYRAVLAGQSNLTFDDIWDAVSDYNERVIESGFGDYVPVITRQSMRRQLFDMARPTRRELAMMQSGD